MDFKEKTVNPDALDALQVIKVTFSVWNPNGTEVECSFTYPAEAGFMVDADALDFLAEAVEWEKENMVDRSI